MHILAFLGWLKVKFFRLETLLKEKAKIALELSSNLQDVQSLKKKNFSNLVWQMQRSLMLLSF